MCSPQLILASQGVGAITQAFGAYNASQADQQSAYYNAAVSDNLASDALSRGAEDVVKLRMQTKALKGSQAAAMAANNVALDEQSAMDVLASTDILSKIDQETILRNAEREARGYREKAALSRNQGDNENPLFAGVSTLLGGTGTVAKSWYNFQQTGLL